VPLYDFAGARITEHFIPQSPLRVGALRGLGAYANVFAIESFIDELAHLANLDPLALRLQHLQDARARTVITRCAELAGWSAKRPGKGYGMGFARYKNFGGYLACSAIIDVDPESGAIAVEHIYAAVDCGEVINPDGLRNQIEGGLMQSMSWTLSEAIDFKNDQVMSRDWASYPILGFETIPTIEIALIDRPDSPPLGAGEVAQGPMAAALANAIMDKSGVRLRALPLTAEKLKNAMARRPNVNR
jgi:CO/xanthine dehydrogenase Mo-binding subunit